MENIEKLKEYLLTIFPVRKNSYQKAEFRKWLAGELRRSGWRSHEECYGKLNGSVNVVAGDPDKATLFLCAHYDTPSRMLVSNFISPTNVAAHVLYHFAAALIMIVLALLVSFAVSFPMNQPGLMLPLFVILALGLLWISVYGPANRSNANGNTSGVLALLAIAKALPHNKRVCLLFLDNNERNLLGASAFRKKHPGAASSGLFFNFDCVGDGENLLLMPSKLSRWDESLLSSLSQAFPDPDNGVVHPKILTQGLVYYPSDHRKFKFHVAVCACRHLPGLGYYIPRLRTKRDTELSLDNIIAISEGIQRFVPLYLEETQEE